MSTKFLLEKDESRKDEDVEMNVQVYENGQNKK